jgi:hypothetical protein
VLLQHEEDFAMLALLCPFVHVPFIILCVVKEEERERARESKSEQEEEQESKREGAQRERERERDRMNRMQVRKKE